MTKGTVQIIQLSVEDLTDIITSCVATELQKHNSVIQLNTSKTEESEIITREEASKLLNLSFTSLWKYNKEGILPAKKLGNKVFYLRQDVYNHLKIA